MDSPDADLTEGVAGGAGGAGAADVPVALFRDAPVDRTWPARNSAEAIPTQGGVNLNALLFSTAGEGPHPIVLLLHGLPGNEQNLDLAQAIRRAGWHVLTVHYRGSWGTPGSFSFTHCLEDAAAAYAWLGGADASKRRIDAERVVVIGHSMGGFVAAHLAASNPAILAACLISGVDLGSAFGAASRQAGAEAVDDNVGFSDGLHILAGTSAAALAAEAAERAPTWRLDRYAAKLVNRPVLLVTSDDGFAAGSDALANAIEATQAAMLSRAHIATDHSYSDRRIGLQSEILNWLAWVTPLPIR